MKTQIIVSKSSLNIYSKYFIRKKILEFLKGLKMYLFKVEIFVTFLFLKLAEGFKLKLK